MADMTDMTEMTSMIDATDIDALKREARKKQAQLRDQLCESLPDAPNHMAGYAGDVLRIAERKLGARLARPLMVAGYWPMRNEIDPLPLMAVLCNLGCATCLPIIPKQDRQPLSFHRWQMGDDLANGPHGTKQPPASATRVIPQLVLVPLLAFDRLCFRLGYGGGFYDRSLAQLRPPTQARSTRLSPYHRPPSPSRPSVSVVSVGVAFAGQEIDIVPTNHYDMPLDAVVCETGMIERPAPPRKPQANPFGQEL